MKFVSGFPQGISPGDIERHFKLSRTTLNRRLREALQAGTLVVTGKGPATRYHSADPLSVLRAYFAKPHTDRKLAPYREELLEPEPGLSAESLARFDSVPEYVLNIGKQDYIVSMLAFY